MSEKINQIQLMEQNLQQILNQKQQFQGQLVEIDSALDELAKSEDAYKIIGNIMVKVPKNDLTDELKEKKERVEVRIKSIEKQEAMIKTKSEELRKQVLDDMSKEGKDE